MHAPGFPVYQVFPGAGNAPTILVTSEPLSHVTEWQFLGKAPTNMPVHQVVHSLQQTLATWTMWTPDMVALACFNDRWHLHWRKMMSTISSLIRRKINHSFQHQTNCWTTNNIKQPFFPTHQTSLVTISEGWNSLLSSWPSVEETTNGWERGCCSACCKQTTHVKWPRRNVIKALILCEVSQTDLSRCRKNCKSMEVVTNSGLHMRLDGLVRWVQKKNINISWSNHEPTLMPEYFRSNLGLSCLTILRLWKPCGNVWGGWISCLKFCNLSHQQGKTMSHMFCQSSGEPDWFQHEGRPSSPSIRLWEWWQDRYLRLFECLFCKVSLLFSVSLFCSNYIQLQVIRCRGNSFQTIIYYYNLIFLGIWTKFGGCWS